MRVQAALWVALHSRAFRKRAQRPQPESVEPRWLKRQFWRVGSRRACFEFVTLRVGDHPFSQCSNLCVRLQEGIREAESVAARSTVTLEDISSLFARQFLQVVLKVGILHVPSDEFRQGFTHVRRTE